MAISEIICKFANEIVESDKFRYPMGKKQSIESVTLRGNTNKIEERTYEKVVINDLFGMSYDFGDERLDFMKEGQVYHMEEATFIMVNSGSLDTSIDLEDYHLEVGDVMLINSGSIQEVRHGSEDLRVIIFSFCEEIQVNESMLLHTNATQWREMMQMANVLWQIAQHKPFRKEVVFSLVRAIINNVRAITEENNNDGNEKKKPSASLLLSRFKQLVSLHCEQERTVAFYASQLYLTPNHLSAVISKTSGKTVMQWINRAVILRAKVLLKTTDLLTYEIADRLHFPDHATFSKFFKRETGMRPQEYRES